MIVIFCVNSIIGKGFTPKSGSRARFKTKKSEETEGNNRTSDNMASENRANAENVRESENSAGVLNDNSETALKRDKARTKS